MATKLYLHRTEITTPATLPSGEQSSLTADANFFTNEDGTENRLMNKTISTSAQTSLDNTQTADTNAHNYYIARWVSPLLAQTSVAANTWTVEIGIKESNANANFPRNGAGANRVCCYVWKPSNATKYGNILDGNTAADGEEATTSQSVSTFTFSGSAVSSLTAGDAVIVFELWAIVTQGTTTARDVNVYYDGTTENSTTNEAAFISTPENLAFAYSVALATETVTISDTSQPSRVVGNIRALSTETTTIGESLARSYGAVRAIGNNNCILLDGTDDYIDCTNDATLWSQALPKFSLSMWVYFPTAVPITTDRRIVSHGGSSNSSFRLYYEVATTRFVFAIKDSLGGFFAANGPSGSQNQADRWYHCTCVYDNTLGSANMKLYIDKVQQATTGNVTEAINGSFILSLGGTTSNTFPNCNIKDFRFFYNTALTQTNINNIYDNSSSAPTPNYWLPMNEGSGDPVDNVAGKIGTLTAGPVWENKGPSVWRNDTAISESLSRVFGLVRALSTETTTVGDSLNRLQTLNRPLSTETTSVSDQLDRVKGIIRALATETTTVSEVSLNRMLAANRTASDTTVVGESLARQLAANRSLSTETVTIGDNLTRIKGVIRALATETVVIDESLNRMLAANRTLSTENTVVSDQLNRTRGIMRALATETVTTGESLNRMLAAFRVLATETTSISDQLDYVYTPGGGATNYTRTLTDTVVIGESLLRMLAANRTLTAEVTAIGESLNRQLVANRALGTETTTIGENLDRVKGGVRTLVENVSSGESLNRMLTAIRTLSDSTSISDNLNRLLAATRTLSDTTVIGESLNRLVGRVRTLVENTSVGESLNRLFTGTRTLVETTAISDSLEYLKTIFVIPTQLKNIVSWLRAKYSISTPPKDPSY